MPAPEPEADNDAPSAIDEQYTFEQYAADANRILDHLSLDIVVSWGTAWGSRAALVHAALNPTRVSALALYDASIDRADPDAQRAGHKRAVERQTAAGIEPFARPDGYDEHLDPETLARALAAAQSADLRPYVERLTMPLLVATGDYDPNLVSSRELVDLVPDARLVVMEDVGHGSVLQRPDLTADIFREFERDVRD